MSGTTAIVFGVLLVAVFLGALAAMLWRNARVGSNSVGAVYVLEDAVSFVVPLVAEDNGLDRGDIRRILEWEVYYLQMQARTAHRAGGGDIVAGGTDQAVEFIRERAAAKQQREYREQQVRAVLAGEAQYLRSIGAVGEVVT